MIGAGKTGFRRRMMDVLVEKHGHRTEADKITVSQLGLGSLGIDEEIGGILATIPADFPMSPAVELQSLQEKLY